MTRKQEIIQASLIQEGVNTDKEMECFMLGAKWADKTMIDKVCGYLSKLTKFVCCSEGGGVEQPIFTNAEIELFKHKMMEE